MNSQKVSESMAEKMAKTIIKGRKQRAADKHRQRVALGDPRAHHKYVAEILEIEKDELK